jgi:hypothetical protein
MGGLTPQFSCKHTTTIAAKPHPKSAHLWMLNAVPNITDQTPLYVLNGG